MKCISVNHKERWRRAQEAKQEAAAMATAAVAAARERTTYFFSKWIDFRQIRWIRHIGQNHPCMNRNQLQFYTSTIF